MLLLFRVMILNLHYPWNNFFFANCCSRLWFCFVANWCFWQLFCMSLLTISCLQFVVPDDLLVTNCYSWKIFLQLSQTVALGSFFGTILFLTTFLFAIFGNILPLTTILQTLTVEFLKKLQSFSSQAEPPPCSQLFLILHVFLNRFSKKTKGISVTLPRSPICPYNWCSVSKWSNSVIE